LPSETNASRKANRFETRSPSLNAELRDFSTRPSAPPMIASSSAWPTLMRGRSAGSTDISRLRTKSSPSPGSATSVVTRVKSSG
jgi:hypothetical protein